jgi:hypothetical protein
MEWIEGQRGLKFTYKSFIQPTAGINDYELKCGLLNRIKTPFSEMKL